MLAHILALAVGLVSFGLYMAAFFFPEFHRRSDFIWSGIGLFYALVLWVCAGRITGGVLLGQTASVALLGWLSWQTLNLRLEVAPKQLRTPLPGNAKTIAQAGQIKFGELRSRWQQSGLAQRTNRWAAIASDRIEKLVSSVATKKQPPPVGTRVAQPIEAIEAGEPNAVPAIAATVPPADSRVEPQSPADAPTLDAATVDDLEWDEAEESEAEALEEAAEVEAEIEAIEAAIELEEVAEAEVEVEAIEAVAVILEADSTAPDDGAIEIEIIPISADPTELEADPPAESIAAPDEVPDDAPPA